MKFLLALFFIVMLAGCATTPTVIPQAHTIPVSVAYPAVTTKDLFVWPVKGDFISLYGSKVGRIKNKGIDIAAEEGMDVGAARDGRVVYCASSLKGFGKTVILDHGDSFQTVYAYNSRILVNVGEKVLQNDAIAKVGMTGRAKKPSLHFEIRKNGEPRDPFHYLPR